MSEKYSTGVRFNHQLGILETLSFVGEGIGAALYIVSIAIGQLPIAVLGILFVVGAVLALRAHLGKPERGWRALTRLATSWVSRGVLTMSCFLGFASLSVAAAYLQFLAPYQKTLTMVALVFAVAIIVYAGMLLRSMRALRLWRGPFVPLAFSAHSAASGLTLGAALAPWLGADPAGIEWMLPAGAGCLVLGIALSVVHLALAERSAGVLASLERLLAGDLRQQFVWGAGALGIVVPLAGLTLARYLMAGFDPQLTTMLLAVVAVCRLYGDFAYRNAVVLAGAYEPLFPSAPIRNLAASRA